MRLQLSNSGNFIGDEYTKQVKINRYKGIFKTCEIFKLTCISDRRFGVIHSNNLYHSQKEILHTVQYEDRQSVSEVTEKLANPKK